MDHKTKVFSAALALVVAVPAMAVAQEGIGEAAFMANCAVCHGADGKGNGPIIDFMKNAPADLTMIASRNGGTFPIQAVYDTIADAGQNRAHGTSEMPIWGNRFNQDVIVMEGEYGMGKSGVPTAQARILELVFYLATIQGGS